MRKKRHLSKLCCCLVLVLLVSSVQVHASGIANKDAFLRSRGVPESVLSQMTEGQKEWICETLEEGMVFSSYDQHDVLAEISGDGIAPAAVDLPESVAEISVAAFEMVSSTGTFYAFYPTVIWNDAVRLHYDTFAMLLDPGWKIISGSESLRVWLIMGGERATYLDAESDDYMLDDTSIMYTFENYTTYAYYVEIYGYFRAEKITSNAKDSIIIGYANNNHSSQLSYVTRITTSAIVFDCDSDKLRTSVKTYALDFSDDESEDE